MLAKTRGIVGFAQFAACTIHGDGQPCRAFRWLHNYHVIVTSLGLSMAIEDPQVGGDWPAVPMLQSNGCRLWPTSSTRSVYGIFVPLGGNCSQSSTSYTSSATYAQGCDDKMDRLIVMDEEMPLVVSTVLMNQESGPT